MLRRMMIPAVAATLALSACQLEPTNPGDSSLLGDDYALAMFGEAGTALEGMMGSQAGVHPFDGRSGRPELPEALRLTDAQRAERLALREAFRAEHTEELEALRAIFQEARAARRDGATREEVRAILEQGRPTAQALRPYVVELHQALRAVLTDAQRAWFDENRPRRFPRPMTHP
jgi:Spy/CpxP family protein refolding chaperone